MPEINPPENPVRRELERIAFGEASSGRALLAKVTALRAVERLDRQKRGPAPPCPPDWVPGPSQFEDLDRAYLDATPGTRERWWKNLWEQGVIDADGRCLFRRWCATRPRDRPPERW
jgi:hypothetical protein